MLNIIYQSQLFGKTIAIFGVQVQKRQKKYYQRSDNLEGTLWWPQFSPKNVQNSLSILRGELRRP